MEGLGHGKWVVVGILGWESYGSGSTHSELPLINKVHRNEVSDAQVLHTRSEEMN